MNILVPSILSADMGHLADDIICAQKAGTDYIHFDVMDGVFVPCISYGMPVLKNVRKIVKGTLDVHLMIVDPARYVQEFAKLGADIISVHVEACEDIVSTIKLIKDSNVKAAVAINPDTPVSAIEKVLPLVDMVLVMTVYPGFGGQKLIPETLDKVRALKEMKTTNGYSYDIEVDGGICTDTIESAIDAGANMLVAGSAAFKGDITKNIKELLELM